MVSRDGALTAEINASVPGAAVRRSVRLARPAGPGDLACPAAGADRVPVIGIIPGQIITEKLFLEPSRSLTGAVIADPKRDLLKLAVLERHRGSGRIGLGLVKGLGLSEGAVASSVP